MPAPCAVVGMPGISRAVPVRAVFSAAAETGTELALRCGQEQCRGAGDLRRRHGGAVGHAVPGGQLIPGFGDRLAGEPHRDRGDRRAGGRDLRREGAVLGGPAGGESEDPLLGRHLRPVVGPPGAGADGCRDRDGLAGHRGRADGVAAEAVVAGGDDDLHAVLVDELVVQVGDHVGPVVEGRQSTDRQVDDVDAAVDAPGRSCPR